ncbi:hypothetical protein QFZ52_002862 [Arthrobacter woluwensis]|uniref:exodeoxyribonuclease VII large subunit n=1 Tax=Arthrobacter woluwensis TaxID=156980 RepID=UPI0027832C3A|nr:exodeoxyribonuclease VII large subunit [Arthrobacter woluwensis]MDQ0710210.1 hypothetical protein [Arthrobacter woluwensis]
MVENGEHDAIRRQFVTNLGLVANGLSNGWTRWAQDGTGLAKTVNDLFGTLRPVQFTGECVNVYIPDQPSYLSFKLANEDGPLLDVYISAHNRQKIRGFLGEDPWDILQEGTLISVGGRLQPRQNVSAYRLAAERIGPVWVQGGGLHHLRLQESRNVLLAKYAPGTPVGDRLRNPAFSHESKGKRLASKLTTRGVRLHHVLLLCPRTTGTTEEFLEQLPPKGIGYEAAQVDFTPASLAEFLGSLPPARNTVVALYRGGGSWADLRMFDSHVLAAAIAECAVPVLTGIGHRYDISLSDRTAFASASTPTGLGKLLSGIYFGQRDEAAPQADRHTPLLREREQTPPAAASRTGGELRTQAEADAAVREAREEQLRNQLGRDLEAARRVAGAMRDRFAAERQARSEEAQNAALQRVDQRATFQAVLCSIASVLAGCFCLAQAINGRPAPSLTWLMIALLAAGFGRWLWLGKSRARQHLAYGEPLDRSGATPEWFAVAARASTPREVTEVFGVK